ncbi:hypothetical protein ACFWN2_08705 [Lentzea sp. NPDC058436]|uniref:hypothetical protein n=1 Tax=Lentzea sp. NPDC058436 TaxID=3346499 RepID=UPI003654AD0C
MSAGAVSALQVQDLEASRAARCQSVSSQVRLLGSSPGSQTGALRDVSRAVTVIIAAVVPVWRERAVHGVYLARRIDGLITFAEGRNVPELWCGLCNQFVVEGSQQASEL